MTLRAAGFTMRCDGHESDGRQCERVQPLPMQTEAGALAESRLFHWRRVVLDDVICDLCPACIVREEMKRQGPLQDALRNG